MLSLFSHSKPQFIFQISHKFFHDVSPDNGKCRRLEEVDAEVQRVFLAKSSFSTRNQANFVFKLLLKIDKVGVTFENTEIRAKNCGEITPFENLSTLISGGGRGSRAWPQKSSPFVRNLSLNCKEKNYRRKTYIHLCSIVLDFFFLFIRFLINFKIDFNNIYKSVNFLRGNDELRSKLRPRLFKMFFLL